MISPRNKQLVVRLCLGAAFAAAATWAAGKVDWRLVIGLLRAADPVSVLSMAGAWIVALCIRPFRTMVLAHCLGPQAPVRYAPFWTANIASLAVNSIVPMRAGDVVMAVILNRSLGTTAPVSVSVVLFDRFFEFATVIVIFATTLLLVPAAAPWMHGVAGVLVPAVVVLAAGMWLVIRLRDLWLRLFDRVVERFSPQRAERWRAPLRDLVEGFARIESARTIALVVGLSVGQWLAIAASWWFGLVGVWPSAGFAAAAFAAVGVMCTARCLGSTTPCTPAPSQQRSRAPRLPGSVTPSTATRNGGLPGARLSSESSSTSCSGAAKASTPCGASLRAWASNRLRATSVTPFLLLSSSSSTIIGKKMSCSSNRNNEVGSCISTLVSSTNNLVGVFLAFLAFFAKNAF